MLNVANNSIQIVNFFFFCTIRPVVDPTTRPSQIAHLHRILSVEGIRNILLFVTFHNNLV